MRPSGDMTTTTDEVIDRFNRAFQERDATLLEDIWGPGAGHSVRGVNVMRVVDGKIVEAAGYSKTAPTVAALEG